MTTDPKASFRTQTRGQSIDGLQYLRFVAAALVLVHHAYKQVPKYGTGDLGSDFALGAWGVDIFFVISGFIMLLITERRETSAAEFLSRRVARVAPMYWLSTALMAVALVAAPTAFDHSAFDLPAILASFGFLAWPHAGVDGAQPVLQVGWTLNFEMFFYLVFAAALALGGKSRGVVASLIIAGLIAVGLILRPAGVQVAFYTNPIMAEFLAGMLFARLFVARRLFGPRGSAGLILAGIAIWLATNGHPPPRLAPWRPLEWGVPAALVVLGVLGLEAAGKVPEVRLARALGDASYAIYLTHFFTLGVVRLVWSKAHLTHHVTDAAFLSTGIGLSLGVGYAAYRWVERPLTAMAQRLLWPRPTPRIATAAAE